MSTTVRTTTKAPRHRRHSGRCHTRLLRADARARAGTIIGFDDRGVWASWGVTIKVLSGLARETSCCNHGGAATQRRQIGDRVRFGCRTIKPPRSTDGDGVHRRASRFDSRVSGAAHHDAVTLCPRQGRQGHQGYRGRERANTVVRRNGPFSQRLRRVAWPV